MSNMHLSPPPAGCEDVLAHWLEQVCDEISRGFVPPAATLRAVRRFNGCMAIYCKQHSVVVNDDGMAYAVGQGRAGLEAVDDPEPA